MMGVWGENYGTTETSTWDDRSPTASDFYTLYYEAAPEREVKPLPKWWRWFDIFRVFEQYSCQFFEVLNRPVVWRPLSAVSLVQRRKWKRRRRLQAQR